MIERDILLKILKGGALPDAAEQASIAQTVETELGEAPKALERLTKLAAWKKLYESAYPKRRGGDRRSTQFQEKIKSPENGDLKSRPKKQIHGDFVVVAAARLKLAGSTINNDLRIAKSLGVEEIGRLWGEPIDNDLRALAQYAGKTPQQRAKVYARMLAMPRGSWEDWAEIAPSTEKPRDAAYLAAAWNAVPVKERRKFASAYLSIKSEICETFVERRAQRPKP